ncbi:MAG: hypothetical protein ACJAWT_001454 [Glaciecola sp.]|jgi:hypothetical protein
MNIPLMVVIINTDRCPDNQLFIFSLIYLLLQYVRSSDYYHIMGKSKRNRDLKLCDKCTKGESVLYRVRMQAQDPWLFVCVNCQSIAKLEAAYQYGGTWKQQKRN